MKKMSKWFLISSLGIIIVAIALNFSCSNEQTSSEVSTKGDTSLEKFTNGTKIGEDQSGTYVITANTSTLLSDFSGYASSQGLGTVTYTRLEILKGVVSGSSPTEYYYGLFATDANNTHHAAVELSRVSAGAGHFNFYMSAEHTGTITCSSTNCPGCLPVQTTIPGQPGVKTWTCTSCGNSNGSCSKTATLNI